MFNPSFSLFDPQGGAPAQNIGQQAPVPGVQVLPYHHQQFPLSLQGQ